MTTERDHEIVDLLSRSESGDDVAREQLLARLYTELRSLALSFMHGQPAGHTLQATALVHEAYLKIERSQLPRIKSRAHFMAAAARAMRCVLIDHARKRRATERIDDDEDGERVMSALDQVVTSYEERAVDLAALDRALQQLAAVDERMARAVDLRFFGGLGVEETASLLGMNLRTFEREWSVTRRWLLRELKASA